MPRRTFFSFHYQHDIWRVNQVRNAWAFPSTETVGFWDDSLWERTKLRGDAAIKALIDQGMQGTSVTVVLIGTHTAERKYVKYEIAQSHRLRKGLLGVYIHDLGGRDGKPSLAGQNPFRAHRDPVTGRLFSDIYRTYYWYGDGGRTNIGSWTETAVRQAGRS